MQFRKQKSVNKNRIFIFVFCLTVTALFPLTALAQETGPVYIVQPGDTLFLIAQRFGTTVEAIASINNITDPSVIVPGSELVIPGFEGVTGIMEFHEVEFGESISSLSARFNLWRSSSATLRSVISRIMPSVPRNRLSASAVSSS